MNLRLLFLSVCVFTISSALPTPEDEDFGNEDVDDAVGNELSPEAKAKQLRRSLIEVGEHHPKPHTVIHPPGHVGGITDTVSPTGNVVHHLGDHGNPQFSHSATVGGATSHHLPAHAANVANASGHVIHPPTSGAQTGTPPGGTQGKPPAPSGSEKGFWEGLADTLGDNLAFVILCVIMIVLLITIVCCSAILINMINKKPSIATVNEEFEKWKEQELNADGVAVETTDGIKLESYPRSGRSRVLYRPNVKFQGIPEEQDLAYTRSFSTLTTSPDMSVSDDRLKQIEKEIRELEASMRNSSSTALTSDFPSYPKELETLAGRPEQLRNLDNLTRNSEEIRDLQSIVGKPEELKSVDKLTDKPDELRNLGHIVGRDNSQQLKDIHMIIQHPTQLNQMTALVEKPEQLDTLMKLADRDFSHLEHYPTTQEKPKEFGIEGSEPIYQRQLSEKSEAIAKLDSILEGFSEPENVVPTNITQEARKQAKLPSGVHPPSRGAVAVLPVPGFKKSSREEVNGDPPVTRTKPTISLYSTKTTTPRAYLPSTTRSLPRGYDMPEPRQSIAFGSSTTPTVPQPLKARTGRTSSGGHRNLLYGTRQEYQGSDPDLASRVARRVQFIPEHEGETSTSLDNFPPPSTTSAN